MAQSQIAGGVERDGDGFSVVGPDGVRRFEEDPRGATPAWRRALEISARTRSN
jgi:hypothetical protein